MITVFPLINDLNAFCISYSFSGLVDADASSIIIIFASFNIARAIAILCFSPTERFVPLLPITVFSRLGNLSKIESQDAK